MLKKTILLLVLLVTLSCSHEGAENTPEANGLVTEESPITTNAQIEFLEELQAFNDSYEKVIDRDDRMPNTRGFWSAVGDVLVVAGADVMGAGGGAKAVQAIAAGVGVATGGTGYAIVTGVAAGIAGAGSSIAAGRALRAISDQNMRPCYSGLSIHYPSEYVDLEYAGRLHNTLISDMLSPGLRSTYSPSAVESELLSNEYFMKTSEQIAEIISVNIHETDGILKTLDDLEKQGFINKDQHMVFSFFFDIYNESKKLKHIEDIVNYYISAIAKTEVLNDSDKVVLISAFSVASQSPSFWIQDGRAQ